jgi:hypothetical protein
MPAITLTTSDPPSTTPSEGANTPHLAVRAKQATGLRADRPPRSGLGRNGVPSLRRFPTLALLASLVGASAFAAPPALALTNPERHYEMVSPPYKGGYGVNSIEAVSPDGESVAFYSNGAFAGAPSGFTVPDYVARRGASEWSTVPVMPPESLLPYTAGMDVSPSLGSVLAYGKPGPNEETAFEEGTEEQLLLHDTATADTPSGWEPFGETMKALGGGYVSVDYNGASADFCHVVIFESNANLLPVASEAANPNDLVYDMARGCAGEPPGLHVVGLNNSGRLLEPACSENFGSPSSDVFNAISAGGHVVFFTDPVTGVCGHAQLFVRLGASRTLEVSKPAGEACQAGGGPQGEVPCERAALRAEPAFVGASRDGSRVFFTTTAQLAPGEDSDSGNDLYMASIDCPAGEGEVCASPAEVANAEVRSLVQVSHDVNAGEAAEVQGAVRVAPDGSRAYFVARGVLGEGANPEGGLPVKGADNLYVYDSRSGKTVFVAELCSGPGVSGPGGSLQSGAVEDIACPSDLTSNQGEGRNDAALWNDLAREVQTAGSDGRFLVFATYARLITSGPQADTDDAKDVYRYDAASGALSRVSLGEAGVGANGNANGNGSNATIAPAELGGPRLYKQYELGSRAASEDGSRVVFTTAQALSPSAINDAANAYEWHETARDEGAVSLISPGAGEPISQVVISPAGNDVFFRSSQSLLAQDTDSAPDIYDARIGPGFPVAPAARQECSGDACQGPLTNPAALLIPGSVSQAPGENVLTPPFTSVKPNRSTTAQKLAAARKACRKKHNRRKRALCKRSARRRYAAPSSAKNGSHR